MTLLSIPKLLTTMRTISTTFETHPRIADFSPSFSHFSRQISEKSNQNESGPKKIRLDNNKVLETFSLNHSTYHLVPFFPRVFRDYYCKERQFPNLAIRKLLHHYRRYRVILILSNIRFHLYHRNAMDKIVKVC